VLRLAKRVYGRAFFRMRIPNNGSVPAAKLSGYLLTRRAVDDKSLFLKSAGFTPANWRELEAAIRSLASEAEATEDGTTVYGTFWRASGPLRGPRRTVNVVTIWIQWAIDGSFHFVTLKPLRSKKS